MQLAKTSYPVLILKFSSRLSHYIFTVLRTLIMHLASVHIITIPSGTYVDSLSSNLIFHPMGASYTSCTP